MNILVSAGCHLLWGWGFGISTCSSPHWLPFLPVLRWAISPETGMSVTHTQISRELAPWFWPKCLLLPTIPHPQNIFAILSWRQDRHGIILSPTHLFSKKFWQPFPFTWNISSKDLESVSSYSLSNVVILETLNKIFSLHLTRKLLVQISTHISTKFLASTGHMQYIIGKGNRIIELCVF